MGRPAPAIGLARLPCVADLVAAAALTVAACQGPVAPANGVVEVANLLALRARLRARRPAADDQLRRQLEERHARRAVIGPEGPPAGDRAGRADRRADRGAGARQSVLRRVAENHEAARRPTSIPNSGRGSRCQGVRTGAYLTTVTSSVCAPAQCRSKGSHDRAPETVSESPIRMRLPSGVPSPYSSAT